MPFAFKWNENAIRLWLLAWFTILFVPGCSLFSVGGSGTMGALPDMGSSIIGGAVGLQSESSAEGTYIPVGANATLPSGSFSQPVHQAVQKAKQENSIVLQILGSDEPVRVLPLPKGKDNTGAGSIDSPGSGVFVSTLLKQTGVLQKYGRITASLYRPSPSSFEGVRMDVLFARRDHTQVRPESDYALHPGDRLVIREDDRFGLDSLLDMALGR